MNFRPNVVPQACSNILFLYLEDCLITCPLLLFLSADSFPAGCGVCDLPPPPATGELSEALLVELFVSSPLARLLALAMVLHDLVTCPSLPNHHR